jgi:hypothetical protein
MKSQWAGLQLYSCGSQIMVTYTVYSWVPHLLGFQMDTGYLPAFSNYFQINLNISTNSREGKPQFAFWKVPCTLFHQGFLLTSEFPAL